MAAAPSAHAHASHFPAALKSVVDEVVTVDEASIALAILRLIELEKSVVEGAGATPLAMSLRDSEIHNSLWHLSQRRIRHPPQVWGQRYLVVLLKRRQCVQRLLRFIHANLRRTFPRISQ